MKYAPALAVIALLGLGFASCGGTGGQDGSTASPSPAGTTPSSASSGGGGTAVPVKPSSTHSNEVQRPGAGQAQSGSNASSSSEGFPPPAPRHERYPHGDTSIQKYGSKAGSSDSGTIASAVTRYYAAIAAGDGAAACSLLAPSVARAIVKTFSRAPALRGKGCSEIIPKLLKVGAGPTRAAFVGVKVTSVRVDGNRAFALLHSRETPSGEIPMIREAGTWKVNALIGSNLP
jgi:hypothetical protein